MSGELSGEALDVRAINGDASGDGGVRHGALLGAFAEACITGTPDELTTARSALADAAGAEALVEAAATVGNFERMVRIADSTGIPVDAATRTLSHGIEDELDLGRFESASNTPERSTAARLTQSAIGTLLHGGLKLASRFRSR